MAGLVGGVFCILCGKFCEAGLPMQRHGVVDAVGDSCLVQSRDKIFSVVYKQRVLGVGARVAFGDLLRGEPFDVGEECVVAFGDGLAGLEF